jgi:hypothetical protein
MTARKDSPKFSRKKKTLSNPFQLEINFMKAKSNRKSNWTWLCQWGIPNPLEKNTFSDPMKSHY